MRKLLTTKLVCHLIGKSRATLYRYLDKEIFIKPIQPGGPRGRLSWYEDEVVDWMDSRRS